MRFKTVSSPHRTGSSSVSKVMLKVLAALLPGTAAMLYFFGWGVLTNLLIAIPLAVAAEALALRLRQRPIKPAVSDLSIVVTAWLFALAIPAAAPAWLIAVGIIFATLFGKQLYGGLGFNPFNPAMIGYIVLLISFPVQMTQWPAPAGLAASSLAETWNLAWGNISAVDIDGFTGATALDYTKTQLGLAMQLGDISHAEVYGSLGAQAWEWVALAYLLGGVALIALRVMPWHAPLGMLLALFTLAQLMHFYDADSFPGGLFQLFSGGAMLGAFFIITDPVSGCTSNRGRFIFGVLVGLLVYLIRTWGNYPDGIAFSVLLANMAAPTIDYYSKPRVFGTSDASGKGGKNG